LSQTYLWYELGC